MRIVSLLPSATEIVCAVGAGPELVAVTHECDHPNAVRGLPTVTSNALPLDGAPAAMVDRHIRAARHTGSSIYTLDARRLAELLPDLIITQELCDVCAVSYQQVSATARQLNGEIPILSLEPRFLDDIATTLETVARASGHRHAGEVAATAFRRELARRRGVARHHRPRVVAVEWTDPPMVGGHWVPEMIELAGGVDVLGVSGHPSRYVDAEQLVAAAPDVIVFMPCGYGVERSCELASAMLAPGRFSEVPAVIAGRLLAVDGSSYFNRPGPRVLDGIALLEGALSAAPGAPLPASARWVKSPATARSHSSRTQGKERAPS